MGVRREVELAQEIERRGYAGIYCPSFCDGIGLCEALALTTKTIPFGTSIANIYTRHASDYAQTAALIHELSAGRFLFGIGVSHGPVHDRLGITVGKPLADVRHFVEQLRIGAQRQGDLPPVALATLRKPMVRLAAEIGQGAIWANAARSHMARSLSHLPADKRAARDFFVGNMIPTCISDDRAAAAAVNRKTLVGYVTLPNYQNYWIEAGYEDYLEESYVNYRSRLEDLEQLAVFARQFLQYSKLNARVVGPADTPAGARDIALLRERFPFTSVPYAVALVRGAVAAEFRYFDAKEPEGTLKQLGFIRDK